MSPKELDLTGRLVLISGGAGALGTVIANTLTEHGANVIVADVAVADHNHDQNSADPGTLYVQADCAEPEDVARVLDLCETSFNRPPDTVALHAGMVASYPVDQYPLNEFDELMHANLKSAFVLAQAATQRWIARNEPGLLIFTTSWVQDVPWPGIAPYSASKAAIRSLTRSFARELAPHGIRANALAPGIVAAGLAQKQWDTEPEYRRRAGKAIPLGHLQPAQSVADAFLFLASPLSSYMTGSTLVVDGGCSLYPMDESPDET